MTISFVGQASATGTSVTLPAHAAGDLILIFAYQDTTSTAPDLPAGFTTASVQNTFANSQGHRVGYKIAGSSAETSGIWTNANLLIVHIYRGVDGTTPLGGSTTFTNIAAVTYPALTMSVADGTSWVVGFVGTRIASQPIETPPSGMTNRSDVVNGSTGEAAGHDTNGGVTSFAAATGGGTGFRYRSASLELRAAASTDTIVSGIGSAVAGATVAGKGAVISTALGTVTAGASAIGSGAVLRLALGTVTAGATAIALGGIVQTAIGTVTAGASAMALGGIIQTAIGATNGAATANSVGSVVQTAIGNGAGSSFAAGIGSTIVSAVGTAEGTSYAISSGPNVQLARGEAFGLSQAQAIGAVIVSARGAAVSISSAQGILTQATLTMPAINRTISSKLIDRIVQSIFVDRTARSK